MYTLYNGTYLLPFPSVGVSKVLGNMTLPACLGQTPFTAGRGASSSRREEERRSDPTTILFLIGLLSSAVRTQTVLYFCPYCAR